MTIQTIQRNRGEVPRHGRGMQPDPAACALAAPRRWFALALAAHPDAEVPVAAARDPDGASRALVPGLAASAPFPPHVNGRSEQPALPEMRLAVDGRGRAFLVGEVDWRGARPHAAVWATFTPGEMLRFEATWRKLRRAARARPARTAP